MIAEDPFEDLAPTWTAAPDDEGERLDKHLAGRFPGWSRTVLADWIRAGGVRVDQLARKPSFRLEAGMVVTCLEWPERAAPDSPPAPQDIPLRVVHEDARLVVVDKPAGLVVHPGAGCPDGTLANALAFRFGKLSGENGPVRPGIVHRLDRDTSGLLVVARDDEAHRFLAAQLVDRSLSRIYDALVWGVPEPERIEAPVGRDPHLRTRMAVTPDGRFAATNVSVRRAALPASLVECRLETGRTHQIRVHLAHRGHPVVGDPVYGGGPERLARTAPLERDRARTILSCIDRQCLHARALSFLHPDGGRLSFESPWPDDFAAAVAAAFPEAPEEPC